MDPSRRVATTSSRPVNKGLLALLCLALLCGGLYYAIFRADVRPVSRILPLDVPKSSQPVKHLAKAVPPPPSQPSKLVETNNIAVAHIRNHDHWRAVYLLTSLVEQSPQRIEPLINLGVALAEVGLWEPAQEYLSRARTIDPKNPLLVKNIAILKQAGFFDEFSRFRPEEGGRYD